MKFALATLAALATAVLAGNEFSHPTEGDVLKSGETFKVEWKPDGETKKVNLYLRKGDPDNLDNVLTISKNLDNQGGVKWSVPKSVEEGDQYAIEIEDAENSENVNYSNQFTIQKGEGSDDDASASGNATTSGAAATTSGGNATSSGAASTGTGASNSTAVTSGASGNSTATGSGATGSGASGSGATATGSDASGSKTGGSKTGGSSDSSSTGSGSGASGSGSSSESSSGGDSGASTLAISSFVIAAGLGAAVVAF